MKVTLGKAGLEESWQNPFPETTECCCCSGEARIGFVAHESRDEVLATRESQGHNPEAVAVHELHSNKGAKGNYWLHDLCAVAVYFCSDCLKTTALYNQG